jgi:glucokinase
MSESSAFAILADIGATNARFALLESGRPIDTTTYSVADYASPVEAARAFLAGPAAGHAPQMAVIAAAGPVVNGRVTMTNAAWTVDAERIRTGLGLQAVHVINDFEALGWALPDLRPADLFDIGQVAPPGQGTMAVMGPGTGFGLAALASDGKAEVVLVTEAGHATLPSENRREDAVILALRERLQHVSVERVLSGPGLVQLYHAIAEVDGLTVPQRSAAEIVEHALAGDCEASRNTLEAFCAFLGGAAGNAALTLGAVGGVFIAGGIAPRFTDFLRQSAFRERFEAKGRMASYLARIPTQVIVHQYPAFVGLARLARVRSRQD